MGTLCVISQNDGGVLQEGGQGRGWREDLTSRTRTKSTNPTESQSAKPIRRIAGQAAEAAIRPMGFGAGVVRARSGG